MRYCGIALGAGFFQLATLDETVLDRPPVQLRARFYEPGDAQQVAEAVRSLGDVVVGIGAPAGEGRACDHELAARGVPAMAHTDAVATLYDELSELGIYSGGQAPQVEEGAFRTAAVFETSPEAVFSALQGRRLPAKRHPLGIARRIEELEHDHVYDEGGDLWCRRIEEIEAAGVALAAHRYAVSHACWLGDPHEAVIVLPGSRVPQRFTSRGVLPALPREQLPGRVARARS